MERQYQTATATSPRALQQQLHMLRERAVRDSFGRFSLALACHSSSLEEAFSGLVFERDLLGYVGR